MRSLTLLLGLFAGTLSSATTCYTDCGARFPKWYQGPDRARCQAEKNLACLNPSGLPPRTDLSAFDGRRDEVSRRLRGDFLENGYVISRDAQGKPMHHGDSLLWSAIAMAALPCDQGAEIRKAIVDSVRRHDGRFLRIDPLPVSYAGNETSRDAEIGALFGFATHALRCPEEKPLLAEAWEKHRRFVEKKGKLHEGSNPNFLMNPSLKFAWDLVGHFLVGTARPSDESRKMFEAGILLSTIPIKERKSACYPVHLSTLLLVTTSRLGKPVNELTKREFCHTTRGMDLPLTEWYCGRGNPRDFLASYRENVWEYRHQRCAGWERPDVDPGEQSPGVDYLVMHALAG